MQIENPYHEGELLVQQRVSEVEAARQNGRVISNAILKGALKFIEQQPMVVLASIDDQQNIWASVLIGHPGFITAVNQHTVELNLTQAVPNWYDPLWTNIKRRAQVGMLVIELATRRRLRLNGNITSIAPKRLQLEVTESYPNCPKYIQRRHAKTLIGESLRYSHISEPLVGHSLEPDQQAFIAAADTFFVASAHPTRGADASHRGGNPGFIQVLDDRTLRIPDYFGNSMFNTLGNFVVNPKAGLIFLDFERNRSLQLIGQPKILWDLDDPLLVTGVTRRYWNLEIEQWFETDIPSLLHWEFLDYSPHNPS